MSLRLPPEEYTALCKSVLGRDGWRCRSCNFRENLHVHHIVYRSQGGEDDEDNLITLCNQCHDAVHSGDVKINGQTVSRLNGWRPK